MSILAKHAVNKEDKSNIITLGMEAKAAKKKNPKVINTTIGMLYDEDGSLYTFDSVNKVIASLNNDEKFAYASTPGSKEYHEALKHWVFQDYEAEILANMHCAVMATPGGSGAIGNTLANYLNPGDKVLLPNYMWSNYKQFAYESFESYDTYTLFNEEGKFNLDNLRLKMLELKKFQGRIVLIVNDPCHNPTGYTMSYEEWIGLISEINMISRDGTPFVLLYDMAYIDYDRRGLQASRDNIRLFENLNESVIAILAFSGSKTLGLYGLRIGAQIGLSKSEENIIEFARANKFSSRAKWGSSSILGMNIITKIFTNKEYEEKFKSELDYIRDILTTRANVFKEEAAKVNLKTLPFDSGFFISIPCDKPMEVYNALVKEELYVIPLENVIRVTLSSISIAECKKIPEMIKRHL